MEEWKYGKEKWVTLFQILSNDGLYKMENFPKSLILGEEKDWTIFCQLQEKYIFWWFQFWSCSS